MGRPGTCSSGSPSCRRTPPARSRQSFTTCGCTAPRDGRQRCHLLEVPSGPAPARQPPPVAASPDPRRSSPRSARPAAGWDHSTTARSAYWRSISPNEPWFMPAFTVRGPPRERAIRGARKSATRRLLVSRPVAGGLTRHGVQGRRPSLEGHGRHRPSIGSAGTVSGNYRQVSAHGHGRPCPRARGSPACHREQGLSGPWSTAARSPASRCPRRPAAVVPARRGPAGLRTAGSSRRREG